MIAPVHIKTRGIVLRAIDYSESDRIVSFLTEDFGKVTGIAKGARKSRKRFANTLEPFTCLSIVFSKKKGGKMAFIEEAAIIDHYPGIRENLEKTLTAAYFMDMVDQFLLEGKRNPEIFHLTCDFLVSLATGKYTEYMVRFFELRFLRLAGYEPVLDRCTSCNKPLQPNLPYSFSPSTGGLRCPPCAERLGSVDGIPVSVGSVRTLLLGKDSDPTFLNRIFMNDQCARECRLVLAGFIRYLLGKELKSLNVLNEVRKMGI